MRKFILIAAMVFVSATAQAGGTRTLITQASNDEPAATEQKAVDAPKYVGRPSAVDTTAEQPKAEGAKPVADKTAGTPRAEKPKRRGASTEARVIYELHRHGIYW
jgi:hypothetical protein